MNALASTKRTAGEEATADSLHRRRRVVNAIAQLLSCIAAIFGLVFLAWILWTLVAKGIAGIHAHDRARDRKSVV